MRNSEDDEFMKNLSANEKRKLLRHIESSQQSSHKKSAHVAKNYNAAPTPFNSSGPKSSGNASQASRYKFFIVAVFYFFSFIFIFPSLESDQSAIISSVESC